MDLLVLLALLIRAALKRFFIINGATLSCIFTLFQVFVSLSYRLNAFGFLSWEDEILPGNLGLLDQYLAILWVYENIGKKVKEDQLIGGGLDIIQWSFSLLRSGWVESLELLRSL